MLTYDYAKFSAEKAMELLAIDSPTGFTAMAARICAAMAS